MSEASHSTDHTELATLRWQFDLTSRLAEVHVPTLTDAMCLWEPVPGAWTVRRAADGAWRPDFSAVEPEPPPVVTIGWLTWHLVWWWTGALASARGERVPTHEELAWPGSAQAVREGIATLAREWREALGSLTDADLERPVAWPWPEPQPLRLLLAWVNTELAKNVAEIGVVRHLYLARQ